MKFCEICGKILRKENRIGIEFQILGLYYVLNNIQFPHELRKKLEMLDKHINPLRHKFNNE